MSNCVLGEQHNYHNESLNIEFKEFCLHIDQDVLSDIFDVKKVCKNGFIEDQKTFNKIIIKTIRYYLYKYIPRYASAFINSKVNNAELVIGVDDFSEITGIPFFGEAKDLETCISGIDINHYLKNHIKYESSHDLYVQLDIKKLILDSDYLVDNSADILDDFYTNMEIKRQQLIDYKKKRIEWAERLNTYTCKLPVLIESKRKEFNEYLKEHAPHMLGYQIYNHEMRNIAHLKIDPGHYIYWLMEFKDAHVAKIKLEKPIKPILPKVIHGPEYLISNLTQMRCKFIRNNPTLNYFLITITFPKDTHDYPPVYYFNTDNEQWMKKIRKHHKNTGPYCVSDS